MSTSKNQAQDDGDSEPELLAEDDALEEFEDGDADVAMDSDNDEEATLVNDSIAYFDAHKDSVFAIAQHPVIPSLIATGGSEGDADDAPGKGYIFDTSAAEARPLLPASYSSDPSAASRQNPQLSPLFAIDGHSDSINTLTFTLPTGDYLVTGGLDGRVRAYAVSASPGSPPQFRFVAESQEVPEVNWLASCPSPSHPNTVALGASDGSVWVYTLEGSELQITQSYFLHTAASTAGTWTPDGNLLATVSEDASLYVWDVWGVAAGKGLATDNGMTVLSLTAADARFAVDGGLFSVAVSPTGAVLAAGGAGGAVKIVSLPRLSATTAPTQKQAQKGGRAKAAEATTQAGVVLASLQVQSDGVETLAFGPTAATPLLATGSVDGSVAVFDTSRSFALRRHLVAAHDGEAVVRVEWVRSPSGAGQSQWLLTSAGMDGVVRRWDLRGATATPHAAGAAAAAGLVKEWRGHRGGGEGGGVLGFVQGETGERLVTAGDDGLVLVFEA